MLRRAFHSTARRFQDEAIKAGAGRKKTRGPVDEWLQGPGKVHEATLQGSNYVTRRPDQPFPMNPLFRPVPPLSDAAREDIYRLHILDPTENSISRLAYRFRISEARVSAVLRLKIHERKLMSKGVPLQTHFRFGMERMLRAKTQFSVTDVNYIKPIRADPPYLIAVDEEAIFDKEQALALLRTTRKNSAVAEGKHFAQNSPKSARKYSHQAPRHKYVFNMDAEIPQGHIKRVYKQK